MPDQQPPVSNLPDRPTCVDREEQQGETMRLQADALTAGTALRLLLTGREGIGKSTLALHLGYELARDYPDAQLYCDCRGSDSELAASSTELAGRLLVQLGMSPREVPDGASERHALVRGRLSGRRLLIVFDDVADANQVLPLLGDMHRAAVIVTGRGRLRRLEMSGFRSLELTGFDDAATAELVAAVGGPIGASISPELVAKLRAACGGLPLALAASAARLGEGDEPPEDYVARLEMDSALDELLVDEDLVVKRVFDDTYRVLAPDQATTYRWLGLVPGSEFDLPTVRAALARPEAEVRRLLDALVRRYVLRRTRAGWYQFHDLVRLHAVVLAGEHDSAAERRAVTHRALDWQTARAVALDRVISGRPLPHGAIRWYSDTAPAHTGYGAVDRALAEFEERWASLLTAARTAAELGAAEHVVALAVALYTFAYDTGRSRELVGVYRRALDYADEPATSWQLHRDLAALYERTGDTDLARASLRSAAETGHVAGTASHVEWQALGKEADGDLAGALGLLAESAAAIPLMADPEQERRAAALNSMHTGRVLWKLDRAEAARVELAAAAEYFAGRDVDLHNAARCAESLGDIAAALGDPRLAVEWWERAESGFAARRMIAEQRAVLRRLIEAATARGDHTDADRHRDRSRSLDDGHDPQ